MSRRYATKEDYERLRTVMDGGDRFMQGHQIKRQRRVVARTHEDLWTRNDAEVDAFLRKQFPLAAKYTEKKILTVSAYKELQEAYRRLDGDIKFKPIQKQILRLCLWRSVIVLYFRCGFVESIVLQGVVGFPGCNSLLNSLGLRIQRKDRTVSWVVQQIRRAHKGLNRDGRAKSKLLTGGHYRLKISARYPGTYADDTQIQSLDFLTAHPLESTTT
jgi:hypothetical protein